MQTRTGDIFGNTTCQVTNGSNRVIAAALSDWSRVTPGSTFSADSSPYIPVLTTTPPASSSSGFWEATLAVNWPNSTDATATYVFQTSFSALGFTLSGPGDLQDDQNHTRDVATLEKIYLAGLGVGASQVANQTYEPGTVPLTIGQTSAVIAFGSTKPARPEDIRIWFENPTDASPDVLGYILGPVSSAGFTVFLSGIPTTNNTVLRWAVGQRPGKNLPNFNTQNANYSFALSDASNVVLHNDNAAHTWTIPAFASLPFAPGSEITICNFSYVAGLTIHSVDNKLHRADGISGVADRSIPAVPALAYLLHIVNGQWLIRGTFT